jgi:hypothetical protein
MSAQLSIGFKPSYAGGESWQAQLILLRTAVEHLGRKEVAFELDVNGSTLSDALNERDRKRWAAEWTHVLKAMLSIRRDDISRDLHRKLVEADAVGFVVEEQAALTPEEMNAAYERELRALGDGGKAAIERVRRRGGSRR